MAARFDEDARKAIVEMKLEIANESNIDVEDVCKYDNSIVRHLADCSWWNDKQKSNKS